MLPLRLIPAGTRFRFMRWRGIAIAVEFAVILVTVASLWLQGLNLGLDFKGGILLEARGKSSVELSDVRTKLEALRLGEVSLQTFGSPSDILIRVQAQSGAADRQDLTVAAIRALLEPAFEIRRTEFIGPQVSRELLRDGVLAGASAVLMIGLYVWFRFEWQLGFSAMVTTLHDVIATIGLFSFFQLEFNLTVIAALLTIAGYSVNDTVVIFDRIRENLRRYKTMPIGELIDVSVNQTLSRTLLTSGTTLLAVLSLLFFGGPVLRNFSIALAWGILIGTYSSIFVASPLLLYLKPLRRHVHRTAEPVPGDRTHPTGPNSPEPG